MVEDEPVDVHSASESAPDPEAGPRISATVVRVVEVQAGPGRFTSHVLDKHLAPQVSAFTGADIPELKPDLLEAARLWLPNHFLNSVFRASHAEVTRQYAFNFLRRASNAVNEYVLAREQTLAFLQLGEPSFRFYMSALHHWETFLAQSCMAYYLHNHLFAARTPHSDEFQRVESLYNHSKHAEGLIKGGHYAADSTLVVWMSNDGLASKRDKVTWKECADLLAALEMVADVISDPVTMKSKIEKLRAERDAE